MGTNPEVDPLSTPDDKILQIIPCHHNIAAVSKGGALDAVVAWALTEDARGIRAVVGLVVADVDSIPYLFQVDQGDFARYEWQDS